jgi:hypothetical protein
MIKLDFKNLAHPWTIKIVCLRQPQRAQITLFLNKKTIFKRRQKTYAHLVFETVSCCLLFSPLKKRGGWVQWTCIKN